MAFTLAPHSLTRAQKKRSLYLSSFSYSLAFYPEGRRPSSLGRFPAPIHLLSSDSLSSW